MRRSYIFYVKVTGSIYLHCDPTASHYLKILMDGVFGPSFFKNEIIWRRTTSHMGALRCGNVHDVLLYFTKGEEYIWNETFQKYDEEYVRQYYRYEDENGRKFMSGDLTGAGAGPARTFGDHGSINPPVNRHWGFDQDGIDRALKENRIYWTRNGIPRWKFYLDESEGLPLQDVWNDVQALRSWHDERLGYPTQKPEALLERILKASSHEGDTVLDPFCGCGTAIAVAQRLNRRWIGIDITHLAIGLIKKRLDDAFGEEVRKMYEVIGEPVDLAGAQKLANEDKFQFQSWALSLVGARQAGGVKKGADRGIDGRLIFFDENKPGRKEKQIIFSVKGGGVQVKDVRDLRGVIEREKAEIGVLISMEPPTKPMMKEAIETGFYQPPGLTDKYPRIQILSIAELLVGKKIEYPRLLDVTYKKAPRARKAAEEQIPLTGAEEEGPF